MRFSVVAASVLSLAAGASAWSNNTSAADDDVYVTEVVTAYTTFCPGPTVISHAGETYTITKATTLTITNCPCTITKPIIVSTVTSCTTCTTEEEIYTTPAPVAPVVPAPPKNVTYPTTKSVAASIAPTITAAATFTGAANKAFAASGAGLAGLLGLAAYIL
ncbi:hypothetical protein GP486_008548 [Trichoglossum hirsutum]|uniref:Clock-controlled protein 6 n=1 Tax=Trichoglossum hirsutum TaxID=265104 RepID=A0A9P8IAD3_9PEZI|nr:hypothetical protein GP486_008548 [Trichoglossum hirsutum]